MKSIDLVAGRPSSENNKANQIKPRSKFLKRIRDKENNVRDICVIDA